MQASYLNYVVYVMICLMMAHVSAAVSGVSNVSEVSEDEISYLLSFVKESQCTFIRNKKHYNAEEAYSHIQKKYAHFRDEISSAEEFIEKSAKGSLITGKQYSVKCPNIPEPIYSTDWLLEALKVYRD